MIVSAVLVLLAILGISLAVILFVNQSKSTETAKSNVNEATSTSNETKDSTKETGENNIKDPEKIINEMIATMSVEEKVGQLFLARVPIDQQLESIKNYHLGGYLLFGRDVESETPDSLKDKIKSYQSASKVPLFIASDEEGGTVSRLSRGTGLVSEVFKSPQEVYQESGWPGIRSDIQKKQQYSIRMGSKGAYFLMQMLRLIHKPLFMIEH